MVGRPVTSVATFGAKVRVPPMVSFVAKRAGAALLTLVIVLIVIFFVFNRQIVEGITAGSVK